MPNGRMANSLFILETSPSSVLYLLWYVMESIGTKTTPYNFPRANRSNALPRLSLSCGRKIVLETYKNERQDYELRIVIITTQILEVRQNVHHLQKYG